MGGVSHPKVGKGLDTIRTQLKGIIWDPRPLKKSTWKRFLQNDQVLLGSRNFFQTSKRDTRKEGRDYARRENKNGAYSALIDGG